MPAFLKFNSGVLPAVKIYLRGAQQYLTSEVSRVCYTAIKPSLSPHLFPPEILSSQAPPVDFLVNSGMRNFSDALWSPLSHGIVDFACVCAKFNFNF